MFVWTDVEEMAGKAGLRRKMRSLAVDLLNLSPFKTSKLVSHEQIDTPGAEERGSRLETETEARIEAVTLDEVHK